LAQLAWHSHAIKLTALVHVQQGCRGSGNGYNSEFAMQHNACGTSSVTTSDCSLVAMFSMHCSHAFAAAAVDDGQVLQI